MAAKMVGPSTWPAWSGLRGLRSPRCPYPGEGSTHAHCGTDRYADAHVGQPSGHPTPPRTSGFLSPTSHFGRIPRSP